VRARAHGSAPWPSVAARRCLNFLEPWWSVSDEVCSYGITATESGSDEMTRLSLVTVRAASGEALSPRTCADASSSSFLDS
jgi:hypothetical protein